MNPVKLFNEKDMKKSKEFMAQREDAKQELFTHQELKSVTPPSWLPLSAKKEWERLLPVLKTDFPLSETDYGLMIAYVLAFSRIQTAEGEIRKRGTLVQGNDGNMKPNAAVRLQSQAMKDLKSAATCLGMTMEARSRLALNKAKAKPDQDPFQELMES